MRVPLESVRGAKLARSYCELIENRDHSRYVAKERVKGDRSQAGGVWHQRGTLSYFCVAGGSGRSEYDVRDHTLTPGLFTTLTSILRVRLSGSALVEE